MGAPLGPFWGGFPLNSNLGLDLTLNYCGRCSFCFADLNKPKRRAKVSAVERFIQRHIDQKGRGYAAWLLKQGHAVVFSNRVDPFSATNLKYSMPLIEQMLEADIRFSLQTKGGEGAYQTLDLLDRYGRQIVWYISIETLSDKISSTFARGAPLPKDRLVLVKEIIKRGHKVNVGINPCVPQWLRSPKKLTNILAKLGVWGVWVQPLHLRLTQLKNMPFADWKVFGEANSTVIKFWKEIDFKQKYCRLPLLLDQAVYPQKYPYVFEHVNKTKQAARQSGLEVYDGQQAERSDYFKPYKDLYPVAFPLMQDFVNYCHDTKKSGDAIYWKDFRDFFVPKLPNGKWGLREYLSAQTYRNRMYGLNIPQQMTFEELLYYMWQHKNITPSPVNVLCFSWAADWEKQKNGKFGWTRYIDDDDMPILIFRPEGTNDAYTQWDSDC